MHSINRRYMGCLIIVIALVFVSFPVWAGDAVSFSGNVKKVIVAKSKVAIKDPATKKRFTVVVNNQSNLTGKKRRCRVRKIRGHRQGIVRCYGDD